MKAIIYPKYGSPDVLQQVNVEKPTPKDNGVLVKIVAASANPFDWHKMRADPFLVRMGEGWLKPKDPRLGADIAGVIEAVGANVTQFNVGDAVFGSVGVGGFAEYVATNEKNLVLKPHHLSFEEAAAIPIGGVTALQALRDKKPLKAGQHVLINGASGGIGTCAVQIAKAIGAQVTGVCSARNAALVKSLGADHIIDYAHTDFTQTGQTFDLIVDNVANKSIAAYRRALTPDGIAVVAGFSGLMNHLKIALFGKRGGQHVIPMFASMTPDDLAYLAELSSSGNLRPVIDRCYTLDQTADAIRYLETGRARGKVVITISPA